MRPTLVRRDHQNLSRKQMYSGGWVSSMHHQHLNIGEKKNTEAIATRPVPLKNYTTLI